MIHVSQTFDTALTLAGSEAVKKSLRGLFLVQACYVGKVDDVNQLLTDGANAELDYTNPVGTWVAPGRELHGLRGGLLHFLLTFP